MGGGYDDPTSDDWYVPGSDEEEGKEPWAPDAKDIVSMFERLEKEKVLELKWQCPGRRAPSPERGDDDEGDDDDDVNSDDDIKEEEKKMPEVSEFDFDDFGMEAASAKMTPRRTPGSKSTPKSQKKVASMDNVLNRIRHQQKEKAALRNAKRVMSRSPASPARFRLGMSGSPGASPRRVVSSTGTPLRPTMSEDPGTPENVGANKDNMAAQAQAESVQASVTEQEFSPAPVPVPISLPPSTNTAETVPKDG